MIQCPNRPDVIPAPNVSQVVSVCPGASWSDDNYKTRLADQLAIVLAGLHFILLSCRLSTCAASESQRSMPTLIITVDPECCRCRSKIQKILCCIQDRGEFVIEKIVYEKDKVLVSGTFDAERLKCKLWCKAGKIIKNIEVEKPPPKKPDEPKKPEKKPEPKPEPCNLVPLPYPYPYPYPCPQCPSTCPPCGCPTPHCECHPKQPTTPEPKPKPKPAPAPPTPQPPPPKPPTCGPCGCPTWPSCHCGSWPPKPPTCGPCGCPTWPSCHCRSWPPTMPFPPMVVCDENPPYGACAVM